MNAARLANCDEFISRLPDGYNTVIGENGAKLSVGERQRISIARAFLKDAPVILLDEATASLDAENETLIQQSLSRLIKNKTVMIIAHRMRTIAGADKIVVIKDGKSDEQGSPEKLKQQNGFYTRMLSLLKDGQLLNFNGIKVECILVPGHTWGHMVYLIDDEYLFTGDTIWFGSDGGYSFINSLAEDNELAKRSLAKLEQMLKKRCLTPKVITGHTGWTDNFEFVFRHRDKVCNSLKKQKPHDPSAPYDGYKEDDDTEENARKNSLPKVIPSEDCK